MAGFCVALGKSVGPSVLVAAQGFCRSQKDDDLGRGELKQCHRKCSAEPVTGVFANIDLEK